MVWRTMWHCCGVAHSVALLLVVWHTLSHCCMWCGPLWHAAVCGVAHYVALLHVVWPTMAHLWQ